jgi:hypothetical protein
MLEVESINKGTIRTGIRVCNVDGLVSKFQVRNVDGLVFGSNLGSSV